MALKKVAISVSKDNSVVFFETATGGIRTGAMRAEHAPIDIPIIPVEYDLDQLSMLHPFFAHLCAGKVQPTIHAWDLGKPEPEFLIEFALENPPPELVRDMTGKRGAAVVDTVSHWQKITTAAAANLDRADVLNFLQMFDHAGGAGIYIVEEGEADGPPHSEKDTEPVYVFATHSVERGPPVPSS